MCVCVRSAYMRVRARWWRAHATPSRAASHANVSKTVLRRRRRSSPKCSGGGSKGSRWKQARGAARQARQGKQGRGKAKARAQVRFSRRRRCSAKEARRLPQEVAKRVQRACAALSRAPPRRRHAVTPSRHVVVTCWQNTPASPASAQCTQAPARFFLLRLHYALRATPFHAVGVVSVVKVSEKRAVAGGGAGAALLPSFIFHFIGKFSLSPL